MIGNDSSTCRCGKIYTGPNRLTDVLNCETFHFTEATQYKDMTLKTALQICIANADTEGSRAFINNKVVEVISEFSEKLCLCNPSSFAPCTDCGAGV